MMNALDQENAMLPSLFISHGSPMLALQPGASGPALARLASQLPSPRAIVVVSAHWESRELRVGSASKPDTWHDFRGFPAELYRVQYPAPGEPQLAGEIVNLLTQAGLPARGAPPPPRAPRRGAGILDPPPPARPARPPPPRGPPGTGARGPGARGASSC